jgi:excisionase family DNA binding protein
MYETISVKDAATLLGIPRSAVYKKIEDGILVPVPRTRPYRLKRADVLHYKAWRRRGFHGQPPHADERTIDQAARQLGIPYFTCYTAVRRGELRATQRGQRWYISLTALEEYRR